jgi:hypothetical protein
VTGNSEQSVWADPGCRQPQRDCARRADIFSPVRSTGEKRNRLRESAANEFFYESAPGGDPSIDQADGGQKPSMNLPFHEQQAYPNSG